VPLFTSGGFGLGLVSSDFGLGLKNLVLFTSLAMFDCVCQSSLSVCCMCLHLFPHFHWTLRWLAQVEEALIQRKKQELLERYASDALQTQVEESKKLVGL